MRSRRHLPLRTLLITVAALLGVVLAGPSVGHPVGSPHAAAAHAVASGAVHAPGAPTGALDLAADVPTTALVAAALLLLALGSARGVAVGGRAVARPRPRSPPAQA